MGFGKRFERGRKVGGKKNFLSAKLHTPKQLTVATS